MSYTTIVFRDETTDGEPIYVALHPDLPGCVAQGDTPVLARQALDEVRAMYLAHWQDTGLSAPLPESGATWPCVSFDCGALG